MELLRTHLLSCKKSTQRSFDVERTTINKVNNIDTARDHVIIRQLLDILQFAIKNQVDVAEILRKMFSLLQLTESDFVVPIRPSIQNVWHVRSATTGR